MKKFLVTILSVVIAASCFSFAGCGDSGSTVDKDGNTIITMMVHVDSDRPEGQAYQDRVNAFNEHYKSEKLKARIDFKPRSDSATGYMETLDGLKRQNRLPDIITFDAPNTWSYAAERTKILYAIDDLVSDSVKNDFLEISKNTYQGHLYGLPIQESSAGIFYNKKIFRDAGLLSEVENMSLTNPWTFEKFEDICRRLKERNKNSLVIDLQLKDAKDETATYLLYPFIYAKGGKLVSADGLDAAGNMDSQKTIDAFAWIKSLADKGYTSFSDTDPTGFYMGNYAMYLSSGWSIPEIRSKYAATLGNDWGILPYPQGEIKASPTASWSFGITDNGHDKTAPAKLLEWMVSPESSNVITNATGMIPASLTAANAKNYQDGSPEKVLFDQLTSSGIARPGSVGYPDITQAFVDIINGIRTSDDVAKVVREKTSPLQTKLNEFK